MYQSIPSLTIPPGDPRGFARSSCPRARVFAPLSCPGVLSQSKSSIILKQSAIFALSLKQLSSNSFHMFIHARSEQRDLVPIYTITNTQRVRIYPGKLKFILVKFHRLQDKENQTLFTFLTTENLCGLPCSRMQIRRVFRFVQLWVNAFYTVI